MRKRAPDLVRRDAIAMAKRKLEEGCSSCAEGYMALAARSGATRRDFLKAGLAAAAGLTALGAGLAPLTAAAGFPCETCSFGSDRWCEGCTLVIVYWCIDYDWGFECESGIIEQACSSWCC